ncbi:hypothetical protein Plec18167_002144 [Paecilomyces lecythidis]|uniref:Uncharacterized protein n=1 Tax=Paecilomyces lecythidis TaxID=3004212 RepID=A0ABR3YAS5_9EURO
MAVRSIEKGEAAKREIVEATGCDPSVIDVWTLDLSSYASVKSFAARVTSELPRVDVLLENAGIATKKWTWAEDNESTLTVNVVSTFLLAFLLLPKLKETATRFNTRPNLTIVTSEVHCTVDFKEKDAPEGIFNYLNDESKADMAVRYPTSKLLEVFFVREMAARRPRDSYPVTINMVNPGFCHSELVREGSSFLLSTMKYVLARTTEVGSRTLVHGVSAGPETHGQYLNKCKVEEPATIVTCPEGPKTQQRVWDELIAKLEKIEPGISGNL